MKSNEYWICIKDTIFSISLAFIWYFRFLKKIRLHLYEMLPIEYVIYNKFYL